MMKALARRFAATAGSLAVRVGLSPFVARIDGLRMTVDMEQSIDVKFFLKRKYETASVQRLLKFCQPGMTAVDVGANTGIITLYLARKVGTEGRVFAFEPSRWTFERLVRNIGLNDFPNAIAENAAVGNSTMEDMSLTLPQGYRLDGRNTAKTQTVKLWALDDYLDGRRVDVLKIDTDGWERHVLEGALRTIESCRPAIMFEFCPDHARRYGLDPMAPFEILGAMGYRFELESGKPADAGKIIRALKPNDSLNVFALPDGQ